MKPQIIIVLVALGLLLLLFVARKLFPAKIKARSQREMSMDRIYNRFLDIYNTTIAEERGDRLTDYLENIRSGREETFNIPTKYI